MVEDFEATDIVTWLNSVKAAYAYRLQQNRIN